MVVYCHPKTGITWIVDRGGLASESFEALLRYHSTSGKIRAVEAQLLEEGAVEVARHGSSWFGNLVVPMLVSGGVYNVQQAGEMPQEPPVQPQ
jgi:hypothetical protein